MPLEKSDKKCHLSAAIILSFLSKNATTPFSRRPRGDDGIPDSKKTGGYASADLAPEFR